MFLDQFDNARLHFLWRFLRIFLHLASRASLPDSTSLYALTMSYYYSRRRYDTKDRFTQTESIPTCFLRPSYGSRVRFISTPSFVSEVWTHLRASGEADTCWVKLRPLPVLGLGLTMDLEAGGSYHITATWAIECWAAFWKDCYRTDRVLGLADCFWIFFGWILAVIMGLCVFTIRPLR